jgi:hypothetical protein
MSWINTNSYLLIQTQTGKDFASRNNLRTNGDLNGANFFNEHILISVYEERDYLHADYYDLTNLRWCRELENHMIEHQQIPTGKAREIYEAAREQATDECLGKSSMAYFIYYLTMIEKYMQDFLKGDFSKYESLLTSLEGNHRLKIEEFRRKYVIRTNG